jgi:hypothetical protein
MLSLSFLPINFPCIFAYADRFRRRTSIGFFDPNSSPSRRSTRAFCSTGMAFK